MKPLACVSLTILFSLLAVRGELHAQANDASSAQAQPSETLSAPVIRLENMTKLSGTNIGFPSDARFLFSRIRTNMNPQNLGHTYAFDETEVVRIHNDGNADLVIEELELSDPASFAFQKRDFENLPIAIEPDGYYDLSIVFVKADAFWKGATGVYYSDLVIRTNGGDSVARLAGHYQVRPEGSWEPTVRDISEMFGFHCTVPQGKLPMAYPTPATMAESYYGEIVVSEYWEQADPSKPVSVMFIYALGGGGHPNLKFLDESDEIVAGVDIRVNGRRQINGQEVWVCQTVFPWEEEDTSKVVGQTVERILKPFKMSISGRTTSGTGDINPQTGKPATLGLRFFPLKTERGDVIPNEYMIAFDVVPVKGSHANGDFNDYVLYVSNVRPKDNQVCDGVKSVRGF